MGTDVQYSIKNLDQDKNVNINFLKLHTHKKIHTEEY